MSVGSQDILRTSVFRLAQMASTISVTLGSPTGSQDIPRTSVFRLAQMASTISVTLGSPTG